MTRISLASLALALMASQGAAQGFLGAELSGEFGIQTEDSDLSRTIYGGGVEFGITPQIAIGATFTDYGFSLTEDREQTLTLHGSYRLASGITAGLFYGTGTLGDDDVTTLGVEGATSLSGIGIEAYVGQVDVEGETGTILGAEATYALGQAFSLQGSFDRVATDEAISRIAIGGAYRFQGGPQIFAEIGQFGGDVDDASPYVSVGARIGLGPNGGVTFGDRSLLNISSGF
jgi:hypothetical protein